MPVIIKIIIMISLKFRNFVQKVQQKGTISEAVRRAEEGYSLKAYKISQITAAQAIKIYQSIYLKFYKSHNQLISTNWYENELRIFVWAVACYTYLHDLTIEELNDENWPFFSSIFDQKDVKLFEYQCHALCYSVKNKNWVDGEDNLLTKIIQNEEESIKWNQVSKILFHRSGKTYFKTAKQCRERWNNHLDPSKVKGYWKAQQCLLMFSYVKEHGKKWANLVKLLKNTRNQHSVKNKFNSIVKRHRKISPTTDEGVICEQIMGRIRHSIANKAKFQNEDLSFDLQDFQDQGSEVCNKNGSVVGECHRVTQNFFKILQNYHSSQEQQKCSIKAQSLQVSPPINSTIILTQAPQLLQKNPDTEPQTPTQNPLPITPITPSHVYCYQQPQNPNINNGYFFLNNYYRNGTICFPTSMTMYK